MSKPAKSRRRGGARPGAGRPRLAPEGSVRLDVLLTQAQAARLDAMAEERVATRSDVVRAWLDGLRAAEGQR